MILKMALLIENALFLARSCAHDVNKHTRKPRRGRRQNCLLNPDTVDE